MNRGLRAAAQTGILFGSNGLTGSDRAAPRPRLRILPVPESRLCLEVPVSAQFLHVVAGFMKASAELAGFDEESVEAIEIACLEAVENVIDHSGLAGVGKLRIQTGLSGDLFHVEIRDRGVPWPNEVITGKVGHEMPPIESPRGRGIAMMRALMDEVVPSLAPDGEKVLRLTKRLIRAEAASSGASTSA